MDSNCVMEFLKGMVKPQAVLVVILMAALFSRFQRLKLDGGMAYSIFKVFFISPLVHYQVCVAGYTAGRHAKHISRWPFCRSPIWKRSRVVTWVLSKSNGNIHKLSWVNAEVLGQGSYGTVYLAITNHPSFRLLAVKSADLPFSDSLIREKLILQELADCPQVVRCFGNQTTVESTGRRLYNLLLEYAPGGTLHDIIRKNCGQIPEAEIREYTRMILMALKSIHAGGFVHCDLKPANILAFPDGGGIPQLKVADFGLAKFPEEEEANDKFSRLKFRGTPIYMSPESVAVGMVEPALDIWSLGCIVMEMFTGKTAMKCDDLDTLMFELGCLRMSPAIPTRMSDSMKDFLSKCFACDPSERWTAEMLLSHPFVTVDSMAVKRSGVCGAPVCLPHQLMANAAVP